MATRREDEDSEVTAPYVNLLMKEDMRVLTSFGIYRQQQTTPRSSGVAKTSWVVDDNGEIVMQ